MAAGLPVVATSVGGTPEVVSTDRGRLVPARRPDLLAGALVELAADPGLRRTLGEAGRLRVETHFTIERMVREYADVYRAVA
jgi:glycosyltransferase involved in cell wall biosynthesis